MKNAFFHKDFSRWQTAVAAVLLTMAAASMAFHFKTGNPPLPVPITLGMSVILLQSATNVARYILTNREERGRFPDCDLGMAVLSLTLIGMVLSPSPLDVYAGTPFLAAGAIMVAAGFLPRKTKLPKADKEKPSK